MVSFAEAFSAIFAACGASLVGNITGLLPSILVLLMLFNTICLLVGGARIERFSKFLAKNKILSYTVLPFVTWFFLCNPMVYSAGKFLPQRQRASFIDIVATTSGPMMSIFPHVNPAEFFVWWGIASGVDALGISTIPLAIRFFIAGWVLAVCRGFITEGLWVYFAKRDGLDVNR